MAIKRSPGSEPIVSAAPGAARGKGKVTRKHQSASAAETAESPISASPVTEPLAVSAASPVLNPTFEDIAQLAYCYWEARGDQHGTPEQDWLRAERDLRSTTTSRA